MKPDISPLHLVSNQQVQLNVLQKDVPAIVQWLVQNQLSFNFTFSQAEQQPIISPSPTVPEAKKIIYLPSKVELCAHIEDQYFSENFEQPLPTIGTIAKEFGTTVSVIKNYFRKKYQSGFYELYLKRRMDYAAELLQKGYTANEVSQKVGYGEASAIKFNKMFQKHFGISPKQYQLAHFRKIGLRK